MPIWKGIVLGFIQGLAEFLPISSSGHLVILKEIMHVDLGGGGMFFDVMLHFGTLLAIFVAFWKDIRRLIVEGVHIIGDVFANIGIWFRGFVTKERRYRRIVRSSYRKFVMLIIVSTIPTGIIGYLFKDTVELAGTMVIVPGICLLITAAFLVIADLADDGEKRPKDASYLNATLVGISQGIATMPGLSRSGTTITACLLCGYEKRFAVKYSFIMSIPAVLGAVVLELKDIGEVSIPKADIPACAIATVISAIVGYLSICVMMRLIQGKKYRIFAVYCALAGALTVGYAVLS
ncbi:MAG: undecaprenyl-diphosphate phosphatase [Lachnospiraceae bacterium]|nr:undecaprenyl-diphosphate phosphatase [Lachnospiraceae bacterium]